MSDRKTDTTMTDPVGTDALRDLSTWLHDESHSGKSQLASAAADEVDRLRKETVPRVWFYAEMARLKDALIQRDRLRAVIVNAPHGFECNTLDAEPEYEFSCTCWKADAL